MRPALRLTTLLAALTIGLLSGADPADAGRPSKGGAAVAKVKANRTAKAKAKAKVKRDAVQTRQRVHATRAKAKANQLRRSAAARQVRADRPGKVVGPMANPIKHLPPAKGERIVFGVMGGAGSGTPAKVNKMLFDLGGQVASGGHVVLTGAAPGLPDHSVKGAKAKGGLTVGISSFRTMADHTKSGSPTNFDVLQLTSLPPALRGQNRPNFMGREIDNIERSDVIVIAGGRFGTLGELSIALEERRPIGVLTGSGGVADIVKDVVKASQRAGKGPGAPVIYDSNPKRLVTRLIKAKRAFDKTGKTGPLGDGDVE